MEKVSSPQRRSLPPSARETVAGYLFLSPAALGLITFIGIPMIAAFVLGFHEVPRPGEYVFVGLENYVRALDDPQFLASLRITVIYVVLFTGGTFVASLALALLLQDRELSGLWRTMVFAPHVASLAVVGMIWRFMLTDRVGIVDVATRASGLGQRSWLGDPGLALITLVAASIWFFAGYYMIIFLAAVQDVPRDFHDAAAVDGAGSWRSFIHVTWPLIKPTSFFVLVLLLVTGLAGLQTFDLVYVMTGGGPAGTTRLVSFYVYEQAFRFGNIGYASALASVLAGLLIVVSGILFKVTRGGRFDS